MRSQPELVSVIVAARNAQATIGRALDSILGQDYSHVEIVVFDDASNDATGDIAKAVGQQAVTVIRSEVQVGRAVARNRAIAECTGSLLAIQDADDYSLPNRLSLEVDLMNRRPDLVACSGQAICVDGAWRWRLQRFPTSPQEIRVGLERGTMTMCHPASMVRTSAFREVGGYFARRYRAQDLNLFQRLSRLGPMTNLEDDVVLYDHPILLNPRYWRESRSFARLPVDDAAVAPDFRTAEWLRYPISMARRLAIAARTGSRVRSAGGR